MNMAEKNEYTEELESELQNVRDGCDYILHLNYQCLRNIPAEILDDDKYSHVRRIYMKRNKLKKIPENIGQLRNLVELYLHSNDLEELPEGLGNLENLESLDVSCNKISTIPGSIGKLQSLERFQIQQNNLSSLPPEIGQLQHLEVLDVMSNHIKSLPKEISKCSSLTRLLLDRNQLSWLPKELVSMNSLEELSATGNHLLCLPLELGEMKSLRSVYVDNNPYLHAMPVGLDNQEIGFSSCGSDNFQRDDMPVDQYLRVQIKHSETQQKVIYLPKEMLILGEVERGPVPSLLELAMRVTYKFYKRALCPDDLPRDMLDMLRLPVSLCQICRGPIFTMGYPVVFEGQIHLYSLYRLCLCCSPKCVKLASVFINLPLVYPDPSTQHYAIALVEPQDAIALVEPQEEPEPEQ